MSSFQSLSAALCLLCLSLPLQAEAPNGGNAPPNNDEESRRHKTLIPEKIGGKTYNEWFRSLTDHDPYERIQALLVLLSFGDKAADAVPNVNDMLRGDRDAGVRTKAIYFLRYVTKIDSKDEGKCIQTLGHAIGNDRQSIVRYEAATAITRFAATIRKDPELKKKVAADLVKGLSDAGPPEMRKACISALIAAGVDPEKVPDLLKR